MTEVDLLLREYQEHKNRLVEALASGSAKDYPAYTEMVGRVRGLDLAISLTQDLARKFVENDDE
jgi:hypothetical protein